MKIGVNPRLRAAALTLVEVVILALGLGGIIHGYTLRAQWAEWSAQDVAGLFACFRPAGPIEPARQAASDRPAAWG